ncbi:hypothetical protein X975_21835, partial [Stegodyphus mimosarum]
MPPNVIDHLLLRRSSCERLLSIAGVIVTNKSIWLLLTKRLTEWSRRRPLALRCTWRERLRMTRSRHTSWCRRRLGTSRSLLNRWYCWRYRCWRWLSRWSSWLRGRLRCSSWSSSLYWSSGSWLGLRKRLSWLLRCHDSGSQLRCRPCLILYHLCFSKHT